MTANLQEIVKNVLIVDDDQEVLEMYCDLLKNKLKANIVPSKYPTQAIRFAKESLFDLILIDVTIDYLGSPFGGLDLYKHLLPRYGKHSLLAYSKYITDDLLKRYNYDFNFLEKSTNAVKFVNTLIKEISSLRKKQSCFVAMPFDKSYNPIFKIIKKCVSKTSYQCVRVDQQTFTKSIVEKIFEEIENSKIVIFVSNDKNPNAFYECGYAVALDKEIVTVTDYYSNLPFDIRDRNAIAYQNDLSLLENKLLSKLTSLTENI
ncbi:response regulator [Candidatus Parcubacteria bacterium]|nr:MAG: response regulator [Candidatus Parcubacteria bacterium]